MGANIRIFNQCKTKEFSFAHPVSTQDAHHLKSGHHDNQRQDKVQSLCLDFVLEDDKTLKPCGKSKIQ